MAESTTTVTTKTDLEAEKFNLEVAKHKLEESKELRELIKEQNASADRLLNILTYLNRESHDQKSEATENFNKTEYVQYGRILTRHETELRNIVLIGLKTIAARLGGVNCKISEAIE